MGTRPLGGAQGGRFISVDFCGTDDFSPGRWLLRLAQLALPLLSVLSAGKAAAAVPTARSRRPAAQFPLLGSGSARAAPQPGLVLDSTPPGASGPHRAGEEEPGTQAPSKSPEKGTRGEQ